MSELHVRVEGAGRDVVLLHGWGFHSGAWDGIVTALAARHRVHAIDLPGHGRSGACAIEAFDAAAEAIARRIPAGSIVVGWSLGGLLAQRIAVRGMARPAALALVSSTPCFMQRADWAAAMRAATLEGFARDLDREPQRTLSQFVRLNALNAPNAREIVRTLTARLDDGPAATAAGLGAGLRWLREADLRQDAARIGVPCVVVHGTRDAITPIEAGRWLASRIPGARLCEIEDAAHLPFASHAARFLEAVESLA